MKSGAHLSLFLFALAVAALSRPAMADIYSFKDENGVVHFSNMPDDKRYKLVRREAGSAPAPAAAMPVATAANLYMPAEESIRRFTPIIDTASRLHGVDAALIHAVISAESGYNPSALSKAGAMGLMQLMPQTAKRYGVTNIMDPVQNITGGVRYLRDLLSMFNGNLELAIAAYNAGENAVIKYGNKIPPYAETVQYVPKVLGFYRKFQSRPS
ncbi:MAG TPA: lytic transglycosylase domain-containing protein [Usitatibacter sp.]|nr:lytic transglycosylase domain-containing protein [Usitatibacter sp.]